jgi:hypothetical protein
MINSPSDLSDRQLLDATALAVRRECRTTAELLSLLAELDLRKLYLALGYSSLFTYCTQVLHLSEPAAYSRITAARVARAYPTILTRLSSGDITLSTITLLAGHLADENHEALLDAARHRSKRDVERLVAALHPQPDIATSIRKLTTVHTRAAAAENSVALAPPGSLAHSEAPARLKSPLCRPTLIAPLAPERFLMRVTIGGDTHAKLDRARDLLRHVIPDGDPAVVIDRALTALLEQLEKSKAALTTRPHGTVRGVAGRSRRVPAAVRRQVWSRDGARCAFFGTQGRCTETGFLEFHHVQPFADGGRADVDNVQLRCRAHNQHEADVYFGELLGKAWDTTT